MLAIVVIGITPFVSYAETSSREGPPSINVDTSSLSVQEDSRCTGPVLRISFGGLPYLFDSRESPVISYGLNITQMKMALTGAGGLFLHPPNVNSNWGSYCFQASALERNLYNPQFDPPNRNVVTPLLRFTVHQGTDRTYSAPVVSMPPSVYGRSSMTALVIADPIEDFEKNGCVMSYAKQPSSMAGFAETGGDLSGETCTSRCRSLNAASCYLEDIGGYSLGTCYWSATASLFIDREPSLYAWNMSAGNIDGSASTEFAWYNVNSYAGSCTNTSSGPEASLTANPQSVTSGGISSLTWSCASSTLSASIDQGIGSLTQNSSIWSGIKSTGPLSGTKTYTLTCTNSIGSDTDTATVAVTEPPSASDLTAGSVSPTVGTVGTPISFSALAYNIGAAPSGPFPLLFQVANTGQLFTSVYLAGLAPGGSLPGLASTPFTPTLPGVYDVRACANFNTLWAAITPESDYGNNCGPWTPITIGTCTPAPGCDCSDPGDPDCAGSPSLACTASTGSASIGEAVTFAAHPQGGAQGPYEWRDAGTNDLLPGTGSSITRSFSTAGTYATKVRGVNTSYDTCSPIVTVTDGTTCTAAQITLGATPARIKQGGVSQLTWTVPSVATGVTSCTLTSSANPGWSHTIPISTCFAGSSGSIATHPVISQTTFTLTCGARTDTAIVNILPVINEI